MFPKGSSYYADWRDGHGRRRRKSFPTPDEALAHEAGQKQLGRKQRATRRNAARRKALDEIAAGTNVVLIDADLMDAFPDSDAVNEALRSLKTIADRTKKLA
ncbi:hypothetical protein SAMN05421819_3936 [Bryocella elongata]|uniref:AP2 domain-containing protein n=2 Tax=Bryocella elongata TaxID=863522 RepID=A0A1H6BRA6_9BACT|nr:hypothetical protein SAMN05421819_3936 [Bryocella elongata]